MDIVRNEIEFRTRLSDFETVLPMFPKERILSHVSGEAQSGLHIVLVGMQMEKLYLSILIFRKWQGKPKRVDGKKGPSVVVFCELFMGSFKIDLILIVYTVRRYVFEEGATSSGKSRSSL